MVAHQPAKRLERALHLSTAEGMLYGAMQGAGEHFTAAYALALGATNGQIAVLVSAPQLLGAVAQGIAAQMGRVIRRRKRWLLTAALGQDLLWLPILFLGFVSLPDHLAVWWLIGMLAAYTAFSALASMVWGSIIAEVVPDRIRGRYFGGRSRWGTLANMAAFFAAGGLLYLLREQGVWGFACVFGLAFVFRAVSSGLLTTLVEVPHATEVRKPLGFGRFVRELFTTNLGRALLYFFAVSFMVNLASPYFTPYMLRDLKFDYLTFTLLEMVTIVGSVLSVTQWGAVADRTGNRRMLQISGTLISIVPLLWLFSSNVLWLGFAQLFSGVVWAGFSLVSVNFIYDATDSENRIAYLGYFNAGVGLAVAMGALAGGVLIHYLPQFRGSAMLSIFLVSGVLRLLMGALFLPRIQEVRRVRETKAAELFHILLGGSVAHRPSHHGRMFHSLRLHGHKG